MPRCRVLHTTTDHDDAASIYKSSLAWTEQRVNAPSITWVFRAAVPATRRYITEYPRRASFFALTASRQAATPARDNARPLDEAMPNRPTSRHAASDLFRIRAGTLSFAVEETAILRRLRVRDTGRVQSTLTN